MADKNYDQLAPSAHTVEQTARAAGLLAELETLRERIGRQRRRLDKLQTDGGNFQETKWILERLVRQAALLQIHLDRVRPGIAASAPSNQDELRFWARRYGVTPEALLKAVDAHGANIDAVDAELGGPPLPMDKAEVVGTAKRAQN